MILLSSEEKYRAMPDHSHYTLCSDRITAINEKGKKAFYYTFITALILSAGSMFGIRFNILSLLSDLMVGTGKTNSFGLILVSMLNILTSLFLILLAVFGNSKYKFCNVILFSIYLAMPLSCIMNFTSRSSNILTFAIGTAGVIIYFPMLSAWRDYKAISKTEGFPYFSERFTHQLENPDYTSKDYREDYADSEKPMDEIEKKLTDNIRLEKIPEKKKSENTYMETPSEIPVQVIHRGDGKKKREENQVKVQSPSFNPELAKKIAENANKFDFDIEKFNRIINGDKK